MGGLRFEMKRNNEKVAKSDEENLHISRIVQMDNFSLFCEKSVQFVKIIKFSEFSSPSDDDRFEMDQKTL